MVGVQARPSSAPCRKLAAVRRRADAVTVRCRRGHIARSRRERCLATESSHRCRSQALPWDRRAFRWQNAPITVGVRAVSVNTQPALRTSRGARVRHLHRTCSLARASKAPSVQAGRAASTPPPPPPGRLAASTVEVGDCTKAHVSAPPTLSSPLQPAAARWQSGGERTPVSGSHPLELTSRTRDKRILHMFD
jgi:hypothetical protein